MTSPFAGMDPFIESQRWDDFHAQFIPEMNVLLTALVRPRYTVDVQRYVFFVSEEDSQHVMHKGPDVSIAANQSEEVMEPDGTVAIMEPQVHTVRSPDTHEQKFLVIRDHEHRKVVTVIELLSPQNKKADGLEEYLAKRANYLRGMAHVVEIDLLRGGHRLTTNEPLQAGDYFAFVGRWEKDPKVDVYAWGLRDQLPAIPIPLIDDESVSLNLQQAFNQTYDRAGYDYKLNYDEAVSPPLSEHDRQWVAERIKAWKEDV